ncbi:hypothetical protein D6851_05335 [Altericroceibacterium spongiae]|uniref:DUF6692 domain-containing protein n=1 Tax=Altericroceibacterium spongiae TaxID=2320269 RepID=A0A420EPQ4_9SPHN|nr:DUF6692 family protein [Altericroceibacterium spongiae]RKF22641.1 hypothetical protein D6851_05335 [Altericroceibacterium spongiae]
MRAIVPPALLALLLAACNQNSSIGNDREARVDPAASPAPIIAAGAALQNVETAIIKPETMRNADIQALGGNAGRCAIKLTEVGFPSFLYEPDGSGAIKLNGKLIVLPKTGPGRFEADDLLVVLRPVDEVGNAGLKAAEMIIVPPESREEMGYRGYIQCFKGGQA